LVVSPSDTAICQARAKTDRLDARTLARLLAAGSLDGVDGAAAAQTERLIPPGQTIRIYTGGLGVGTQPREAPIRFFLVRHGDRVLANGSLPRLGSYYELYDRPVRRTVYLVDGTRPQRHRTLAARVHFTSPWRNEILSVWVRKVQPRRVNAPRTPRRRRPGGPAGPTAR
jgi:hypothetical protein